MLPCLSRHSSCHSPRSRSSRWCRSACSRRSAWRSFTSYAKEGNTYMPTRLERSPANKVIGGVCGGIAEYLQIDATLVRGFFVIAAVLTAGIAVLGYIVLLVLMPMPGATQPFVRQPFASADASGSSTAETVPLITPAAPEDPAAADRRRATIGYFLVALGVIFL